MNSPLSTQEDSKRERNFILSHLFSLFPPLVIVSYVYYNTILPGDLYAPGALAVLGIYYLSLYFNVDMPDSWAVEIGVTLLFGLLSGNILVALAPPAASWLTHVLLSICTTFGFIKKSETPSENSDT